MTVQAGLCQTRLETTLLVFPRGGSFICTCGISRFISQFGLLWFKVVQILVPDVKQSAMHAKQRFDLLSVV